ncbi:putative serine protease EDA2 [Silene latifolia]|uniref:putative serine protease EDA2 n=1 Tax=Silene latifolia TaxID=37657 RepID=UPI003D772CC4
MVMPFFFKYPLLLLLLLLLLIITQISVSYAYLTSRLLNNGNYYVTTEQHWFNQTLDHFSPYDHRQFEQRYYEYLDNFRSPNGPIFLKICGESACNGIANDYLSVLAKKFGAAIVSPEHRYYGKSAPFKTHTTENLKYLSSKQALFDLAAFRQYYQESLNKKLNRSNVDNPWFVFGGSYAGALSAWFRLKFPHLTCGSLASSAVVLAVYDFTEFDQQIGVSAGPECKAALQEVTHLVEEGMKTNEIALKSSFGASELKIDGDFLYFLADAAVIAFQYGNPDKLCTPLVEAKKAGQDLVSAYASYVNDYYVGSFGATVKTYNQEYLKNTTGSEHNSDRLWWFQVCSEVAYFQVAPANDSIRSSKVDLRYHLDLCKNVFGDTVYPVVEETNLYYGGLRIAGTKIVFANGSQDPWRHASKQISSSDLPSYLITCQNCGHCVDFRGCPQSPLSIEGDSKGCSSPDAVNKVRQQITEHMDLWLSECQDGDASGRWSAI